MSDVGDVKYLVLADRAVPYLLARVRWPDVAQAMSARTPDWLDDQGLFDLPYDPSAVMLTFPQAASVAASWGRQLHPGAAQGVPSYIRRMPANWSDLSPSERRAWGIESVGTTRATMRRIRRPSWFEAKTTVPSVAMQANGHGPALAGTTEGPGPQASHGRGQLATVTSGPGSVATERRRHARVRVDGRAYVRSGDTTISAGLVDVSESGVRCVLPEVLPPPGPGATIAGPFLLEVEVMTSRICLDVAGQISWQRSTGVGTHFGIAFVGLAEVETEGVQRLLAAARGRGGHR